MTPQWSEIEAWAQLRLRRARERNDDPALDHDQTQMQRGHIAMLKELLRLPEQLATPAPPDDPD